MLSVFPRFLRAPRNNVSILSSLRRHTSSSPSSSADLSEGEKLIHEKLSKRFSPSQLQVQDVSGGCGAFYAISITSDAFKGLTTVKQHKLVTETLKSEIEGIHGLQIKTIPE